MQLQSQYDGFTLPGIQIRRNSQIHCIGNGRPDLEPWAIGDFQSTASGCGLPKLLLDGFRDNHRAIELLKKGQQAQVVERANGRGIADNNNGHLPPSKFFENFDILFKGLFGASVPGEMAKLEFLFKLKFAESGESGGMAERKLSTVKPSTGDLHLGFPLVHSSGFEHFIRNHQRHGIFLMRHYIPAGFQHSSSSFRCDRAAPLGSPSPGAIIQAS